MTQPETTTLEQQDQSEGLYVSWKGLVLIFLILVASQVAAMAIAQRVL